MFERLNSRFSKILEITFILSPISIKFLSCWNDNTSVVRTSAVVNESGVLKCREACQGSGGSIAF